MFHWLAHYYGGESFPQYEYDSNKNVVTNSYADVDRDNLVAFDIWDGGRLLVRVDLRSIDCNEDVEPRRLIYRIRTQKDFSNNEMKIWLIGWQRRVKGRNIQAINYIFEDGVILLGGQFVENDAIPMGAIKPFPHEADLVPE